MSDVSRKLCTYMSKVDEGSGHGSSPIAPRVPAAGRKAARLLGDARRRAGLSQSDLARRVGLSIQTVNRIQHGLVDPRLGTLERLLAECGWTLVAERRSQVDRSEVRELLRMAPLARLAWPDQRSWASRAVRFLEVLAGRRISFVLVGPMAERLHGAPVPVNEVQIRMLQGQLNANGLVRALKVGNRRFQRIGVTAVSCSRTAFEAQLTDAWWLDLPRRWSIPVASLDDLIRQAEPAADLLRCVREESDAMPS